MKLDSEASTFQPPKRPGHWNFEQTVPQDPSTFNDHVIEPRRGRLLPLRTRAEVRAGNETIDVYIIEIPTKSASEVLNVIKSAIPNQDSINIQHLRRFVKPEYLPVHLRSQQALFQATKDEDVSNSEHVLQEPSSIIVSGPADDPVITKLTTSHLLISPTTLIALSDLTKTLAQHPPFLDAAAPPNIRIIPVPAHAPTSSQQAEQWSKQYWPISYKNTNPYGPHPAIVQRAEVEILPDAGRWMVLADCAAQDATSGRLGTRVGCVVVDRSSGEGRVVVVAGDGRWCGSSYKEMPGEAPQPGNVMAHAVMRAIGQVAKKRLRIASLEGVTTTSGPPAVRDQRPSKFVAEEMSGADRSIYLDHPLTALEERYFDADTLAPSGYLCVDLEIYLTHEPCVMCSMAILHSRFNRCVFGQRIPLTGALTADIDTKELLDEGKYKRTFQPGLGYGLFWRHSELNWRFLAWEWEKEDEDRNERYALDPRTQV